MIFKKFLKNFFIFFLIFLFIFNWQWIKQSLKKIWGIEEIQKAISKIKEKKISKKILQTEKENSIEIPKLKISAPLYLVKDWEEAKEKLNFGVVLYLPESQLPPEKGKLVILGHSAPIGFPQKNYLSIFTHLSDLLEGDEIILNLDKKEYHFSVKKKHFLSKNEKLPQTTKKEGILFLISCWPPGEDLRRIAVEASIY